MPTRILRSSGLALLCAAAALTLIPTAATAAKLSKPANLRVVDSTGETLAEHVQYTAETKVKARPEADCFDEGTGGSGETTTVPGATALGAVVDATAWDRDVKPVLVTDAFDFGLGVCGFGDAVAPSTGFWYLKVNHVASQVGGDQALLKKNDDVLWYLIEDFNDPVPAELVLDAPARSSGTSDVRVWEYADDGTRTPAAGAAVTGAEQPTDAEGRTTVSFGAVPANSTDSETLQASRDGAIPSNAVEVCLSSGASKCQSRPPATIRGTAHSDVIRGTDGNDDIEAGKGADTIRSGSGDDRIDVKGGGTDTVRCGSGDDAVKADPRDVLKACE